MTVDASKGHRLAGALMLVVALAYWCRSCHGDGVPHDEVACSGNRPIR